MVLKPITMSAYVPVRDAACTPLAHSSYEAQGQQLENNFWVQPHTNSDRNADCWHTEIINPRIHRQREGSKTHLAKFGLTRCKIYCSIEYIVNIENALYVVSGCVELPYAWFLCVTTAHDCCLRKIATNHIRC